jgi:CRISPR system Cascade subunit CasA
MASFNLVDQPWIPCVMQDGRMEELGIQDTLVRAAEIREVLDSSPLVTAALHRLLLAILHRNFGPASLSEWRPLWEHRRWDDAVLTQYLDEWRSRFDLFDEERPFYQVPVMQDGRRNPVARLAMEVASGNNPTLFDHTVDGIPEPVPARVAARYLLACQSHSIGFGKSNPFYFQDAPLTRGFVVLAYGNNLFETLALNLLSYNDEKPIARDGADLPAWELETPTTPNPTGTIPQGYLDYLTWQSRRVHLFPEEDTARVRWCQIQQNLKLGGDILDPFKCYRKDEKEGYRPASLSPGRSLWRDSNVLFQQVDESSKRPEVFNWLSRIDGLRRKGDIYARATYGLSAFGFAADPGKAASVILWRHERLPLPLAYLDGGDLLSTLKDGLELAESVGKLFSGGFVTIASGDGSKRVPSPFRKLAAVALSPLDDAKADPGAAADLIDHLAPGRLYWARLETPFKRFMVKLPEERAGNEPGSAFREWVAALRDSAVGAFAEATLGLDGTGRTLRAVALAEREFNRRLRELLEERLKDTEEVL